jgi:hypothetical protein
MSVRKQMNSLQITIIMISLLVGMPVFAVTITDVDVLEDFNPSQTRGQLTVSNISAAPIYAFAVGNNDASQAFGHGAGNGSLTNLIPPGERSNLWVSNVVTRASWESNDTDFGIGKFAGSAWAAPDTSTLSWNDLFGSEFNKIIAYWVVDESAPLLVNTGPSTFSSPITSGSSQSHFFFFSGQANSPFITFGQNGTVTARGETTVVPIPAAFWLFGSALLGLFPITRRKPQ